MEADNHARGSPKEAEGVSIGTSAPGVGDPAACVAESTQESMVRFRALLLRERLRLRREDLPHGHHCQRMNAEAPRGDQVRANRGLFRDPSPPGR